MNKKTLVYALALLVVAGSVGMISASARGWGFGQGYRLHTTSTEGFGWARHGSGLSTGSRQADIAAKLADKVSSGTITQEQADKKLEFMADKAVMHEENKAELAEFLGLSVEELQAELDSGKTIKEIAEAQGISEEELKEYHQDQKLGKMQELLQQMVDAGKLTQAEADEKLAAIESGDYEGKWGHRGFKSFGHRGFKDSFHKGFGSWK